MLLKDFLDILEKLEEEFFNNVFVIEYNNDEYIISRRWEIKPKEGVISIQVEKNFSEPTPYHVGEVHTVLLEYPSNIKVEFYSRLSARHFNSSKIENLVFKVRRQ